MNKRMTYHGVSRRQFLATTSTAIAAATLVPRHVLGGAKFVPPSEKVNVALIGYQFMGKAHSNAYRQVSRFFSPTLTPRLRVICGRTPAKVRAAARELGWEEAATDWREVVNRRDVDLVDVSTPGDSHAEIAIAAARPRPSCAKPLANTMRSRAHAGRGEEGRRRQHDLPQLSPRAIRHAREGTDRRR